MKPYAACANYLLMLFIALLPQLTHAQTGSLTYKLNIERQKGVYLLNMHSLANGDNLVSSYDVGDSTTTKLRSVRVKPDGSIAWSRTYIEPNYYQSYYLYDVVVAATKDNGFVAAVRLDSGIKHSLGIVLFRCDSDGNIEWKKKLTTADHSYTGPGPIIQTKDEGYYFVHYGYGLSLLEKLDKNGNLIWSTSFDLSQSDYGYNYDRLAEAADGGALLTTSSIGCEYYCVWYSLLRFEQNGSTAWFINFDPNFYFGTTAYHLSEDNTGTIRMIAGGNVVSFYDHGYGYGYVTIPSNATEAKASIIKYDLLSLQHFLKTKKITTPIGGLFSRSYEKVYFNFNRDRSLSIATNKENAKGKPYLHIERYDDNGSICPDFSVRSFDTTVIYRSVSIYRRPLEMVKTPSMLIINSDLFLQTLQNHSSMLCNGEAPPETIMKDDIITFKTAKQTSGFAVFPNPAKDFIKLTFANDKSTAAQIQIVSMDGKVMKTYAALFAAGSITKTYDVSYLPKGIYLLKVISSATQQTTKFVKE